MTSAVRVVQLNVMQQGSQRRESSNCQLTFTVSVCTDAQKGIGEPDPVPDRRKLVQNLIKPEAASVQALVTPPEHVR